MAEVYSSSKQGQSNVMKKILEQIDRENNENEYNRTEVQDRTQGLGETLEKMQFDLNFSQDVRVLDSNDSLAHDSSYAGQMIKLNRKKLSKTMYGMKDMSNLVYLQLKGKN